MSLFITGTFWEKPPLFCQACKIEAFLPHFVCITFELLIKHCRSKTPEDSHEVSVTMARDGGSGGAESEQARGLMQGSFCISIRKA